MKIKNILIILFITFSCYFAYEIEEKNFKPKVHYDQAVLKIRLTDVQYKVTQEGHPEIFEEGEFYNNKEMGTYRCIVCDKL